MEIKKFELFVKRILRLMLFITLILLIASKQVDASESWDISAEKNESIMASYSNGKLTIQSKKIIEESDNEENDNEENDNEEDVVQETRMNGYNLNGIKEQQPWYDIRENITEVVIKNGSNSKILNIGTYAFYGCSNLKSIEIPTDGITEIGVCAFKDCSSLTEIKLPKTLKYIGSAFEGCSSLKTMSLGGITSVTNSLLKGCTALENITISSEVTQITDAAFNECNSLKKIIVETENTKYFSTSEGVLYEKDSFGKAKKIIRCPKLNSSTELTIIDGTITIATSAFRDCKNLKTIIIPDSVTSISSSAFSGCSDLTIKCSPNSIVANKVISGVTIDSTLGSSDPSGDDYKVDNISLSLNQDTKVLTISGSGTLPNVDFAKTGWSKGQVTTININSGITRIGENAFSEFNNVTQITIPNTVNSIEENAFDDCSKLNTINVNNSTFCSVDGILYNSSKTKLIRCPEGYIKTSFDIPASVTEISRYAFNGCKKIKNIYSNSSSFTSSDGVIYNRDKKIIIRCPVGTELNSIELMNIDIADSAFKGCPSSLLIYCQASYAKKIKDFTGVVTKIYKSVIYKDGPNEVGRQNNFKNGSKLEQIDISKENKTLRGWRISGDDEKIYLNGQGTATFNSNSDEITLVAVWDDNNIVNMSIQLPRKTEYYYGEDLDLKGGQLIVTYLDNSISYVDMESEYVSGFESKPKGMKAKETKEETLTVKYGNKENQYETSFKVKVKSNIEDEITVSGKKYLILGGKDIVIEDVLNQLDGTSGYTVKDKKSKNVDFKDTAKTSQTITKDGSTSTLVLPGDVNSDGKITVSDISKLNNYRINSEKAGSAWSDAERIAFKSMSSTEITDTEIDEVTYMDMVALNNRRIK